MTTRTSISLLLLAALTANAGCSGFGWWGNKQTNTLNNPQVSSFQPAKPSFGSTLADAFTIKPKVIQAEDPLKVTGKQGPIGAEFFLSAARLYENRGEFEAAASQYKKALEVSPKNLQAQVGYARLLDRQNNFDEAAKLYKKALAAHPKNAAVHNDLGLCQARHGLAEDALESMQTAIDLEPANKLYRNNIGAILVDMGRSKEAFEHLVQAHGEAVAHYNLGFLLLQRDKRDLAQQQFTLALEKDPSLVQAREMLKRTGGDPSSHELVQKTQHVSGGQPKKGQAGKSQAGKGQIRVSAPIPFDPQGANRPASVTPEASPDTSTNAPRELPKGASSRAPRGGSVAPASIAVEEPPAHAFPPVRLPEVFDQDSVERAEPAPLPDSTSARLRKFPRVSVGE